MIKEILINTFDKHIWSRYIKDLSFQPSTETLYASALGNLHNRETEKAISYIILTLESDIQYLPAHHLARVMLFGLSEEFMKKRGHSVKEKYPDLNKHLFYLEQTETKMDKDILVLQNNIAKVNIKLKEGFSLTSLLKKKENINQLNKFKEEIRTLFDELPKIKKEIVKINEIAKIEEYTKIIALVLEVTTHPRRFSQ